MNDTLQIACPHCTALNRVPTARIGDRPSCGRCHTALFSGEPLSLDAQSFERHAAHSDIPLLVDFWASWCAPCRMMAPEFERAAHDLEPAFRLGKVDTEAEQEIAARFDIRSIPTLILFRGGREVARHSGVLAAQDLARWARGVAASGRARG